MGTAHWVSVEQDCFAAVVTLPGGVLRHLRVERLMHGRGWDWLAWEEGRPAGTARFGAGASVIEAMHRAEQAAREWS